MNDERTQFADEVKQLRNRIADLERAGGRAPATTGVDSVNGHTGVVVIDSDDIDDTGHTHQWNWKHIHTQGVAATTWTIVHGLGGFPNVTTVDSGGIEFEGDVSYVDANTITVTFLALVDGKAYLS